MGSLSRFQLDLTTEESESIERWSTMAGFRTKKEFLLNAFTMFKWAAQQIMLGRTICAVNEATGEIRHLEMPALSAIAEYGAPPLITTEERRRLMAQPGHRLPEDFFRSEGERNVEADRSLDRGGKGRSGSHLDREPATPR
jgi:hypothetical protein